MCKAHQLIKSMKKSRHSSSVSGSDIDAAAMQFERRFHISVDDSSNRDNPVNISKLIPIIFLFVVLLKKEKYRLSSKLHVIHCNKLNACFL